MTASPSRPDSSFERPASKHIELVILRDPDGPLEVQVFIDGIPYTATEYVIDAGAGWTWDEWKESRDTSLTATSGATRAILLDWYSDPPGGEYIDGHNTEHWLDGAPLHPNL